MTCGNTSSAAARPMNASTCSRTGSKPRTGRRPGPALRPVRRRTRVQDQLIRSMLCGVAAIRLTLSGKNGSLCVLISPPRILRIRSQGRDIDTQLEHRRRPQAMSATAAMSHAPGHLRRTVTGGAVDVERAWAGACAAISAASRPSAGVHDAIAGAAVDPQEVGQPGPAEDGVVVGRHLVEAARCAGTSQPSLCGPLRHAASTERARELESCLGRWTSA